MLGGNPPPQHPFFFLFLSISFPSLFKKKSENFGGGGFEPSEPPPPLNRVTMTLSFARTVAYPVQVAYWIFEVMAPLGYSIPCQF